MVIDSQTVVNPPWGICSCGHRGTAAGWPRSTELLFRSWLEGYLPIFKNQEIIHKMGAFGCFLKIDYTDNRRFHLLMVIVSLRHC